MRAMSFAIGAASLALLIVVAWYLRPAPEVVGDSLRAADRLPLTSPATRSPPVSAHTEARPGASAAESAAAPAPAPPEPAPSPLPGETPVTPMAQLLEAGQQAFPQAVINNELAFGAESVDAAWAPSAEARILDKIAQMSGLQLTGLQVECRSTMCRLQIAIPSRQGAAAGPPGPDFFNSLGLKPRWVIAMADPAQTPQMVAYLLREGTEPEAQSASTADGN